MGLFDWITRRVQTNISAQYIGGKAIYPDIKSATLVRDGYSGNDSVFTIVSTTSKKFASIPRSVYKDTEAKNFRIAQKNLDPLKMRRKAEEVANSEYLRLLQRPNPFIGSDAFFEGIYVSKELLGEAFIWLNRGDDTTTGNARYNIKPLEMYWMPAQNMELICDDYDMWSVLGYIFDNNGVKIRLNKEDVIHWKTFNPNYDAYTREHLRGLSPLKAGLKLLTANDSSKDAMVAMFQNDGAKGVIYNETLDNLTPDQKSQYEAVINRKINNRDIKGAVATMQGKWGYIDLGRTSVDMQLLGAQDVTFQRLCNLWRVSPNLFIAGQTRDNLREARKDLITNKIMPDSFSLDDELNRMLSKAFQGQVLVSDFSSLPEMQYELQDMNLILKDMYDRGIINGNEYREQMGWEVSGIPEHDQFFVSGNSIPIGEAAMPVMNGLSDLGTGA